MEFTIEMGDIISKSKAKLSDFQDVSRGVLIAERDELSDKFKISSAKEIAGMSKDIKRYESIIRKLNGLDYDPIALFQLVMSEVNHQGLFGLSDVLKLKDGRITATITFDVVGPVIDCRVAMHKRNKDYCVTLPDAWG